VRSSAGVAATEPTTASASRLAEDDSTEALERAESAHQEYASLQDELQALEQRRDSLLLREEQQSRILSLGSLDGAIVQTPRNRRDGNPLQPRRY